MLFRARGRASIDETEIREIVGKGPVCLHEEGQPLRLQPAAALRKVKISRQQGPGEQDSMWDGELFPDITGTSIVKKNT